MSAKLTMLHQKTENKNTANYEDLASELLDSNVYTYVEQWAGNLHEPNTRKHFMLYSRLP
jgi:hypothetical protein